MSVCRICRTVYPKADEFNRDLRCPNVERHERLLQTKRNLAKMSTGEEDPTEYTTALKLIKKINKVLRK
ncbi:MAG: hypothetical protein ACXABY_07185 [Candidatus Thorarchaeota archaeon]|jgi:hypothetical protein